MKSEVIAGWITILLAIGTIAAAKVYPAFAHWLREDTTVQDDSPDDPRR